MTRARQSINPQPVQPPRYGLIAAAPVGNLNGVRWQNGVRWNPEQCGVSGTVAVDCEADASTVPERSGRLVSADPFAVWAADECSPFGFQARDWSGRALRQLEATQSAEIAHELWTGELALTDAETERGFLTDHATLNYSFEAADVVRGLGCIEQGLAVCSKGRRGMVHVTPQALVHLTSEFAVTQVGGQILTPLGNIVVADAGYDGSGPGGVPADGTSQWMFGTDLIDVTLEAQATLVPGRIEEAQAMAQALKRSDNTLTVRAFKLALYRWDRCCHVACEVALPVCVVAS